jgi:divalent metal cation (Fe/Co/Zn/Cd) transporter
VKGDGLVERSAYFRRGLLVEYASVAWMLIEALVAVGAGWFAGSLALLAFGGDSFIELISSLTVLAYMRRLIANPKLARTELNAEGVEWFTLVLLIVLLPVIGLGAGYAYMVGHQPESSLSGIAVAIGAVIIMPVLWFEKRRIGKEANILPLSIDAIESATCFFMSAALLAGLLISYFFGIWWIDYLAAAVILVFVAKEAKEAFSQIRTEHNE